MKRNSDKNAIDFALSCPLLLTKKQSKDPYSVLEQFFNYTSLGGYRKELTCWFKCALQDSRKYKRTSNLLFIHEQFIRLINAGYIIAQQKLHYTPLPNHEGRLFCKWMVESGHTKDKNCVQHSAYNTPYWLNVWEREDPLQYLQKALTMETITYLRKGLYEWQAAAASNCTSLIEIDYIYSFDLYESLQKIIEACYLVLVAEVILNKEKL